MDNRLWVSLAVLVVAANSGCIVSPQVGYVNDTVGVNGTAYARNLSHYVLEVGEGFDPLNWSTVGFNLTSGGLSAVNESEAGVWDTLYHPDGNYTIRLTVTDEYNTSSTDRVHAAVNNIYFTEPEDGSFHRAGSSIEVEGRVVNHLLAGYTIEYSLNGSGIWSNAGVALADDGTLAVDGGTLGYWNTTSVNQTGLHALRLTVNYTSGRSNTESVAVSLDDYQAGWPVTLGGWLYNSPALADLDGDGTTEILVGSYYSDDRIYALQYDGTNLSGWPVKLLDSVYYSSPAAADLDGDGSIEVVVSQENGRLYVLTANGTNATGWPVNINGSYSYGAHSSPVLADLDGDNDLEIIVTSIYHRVYALQHDGSVLAGWPVNTTGFIYGTPTVADLDGNGLPEVVVLDRDGKIYAFTLTGQSVSANWPTRLSGSIYFTSPVSGDIDGDGLPEVVVGDYYGNVHAIDGDGGNVTGWPVDIDPHYVYYSSPALADLNDDGGLDVILSTYGGLVYALNSDGTNVTGWPVDLDDYFYSSPVVGDIDSDDRMEVLVGGYASGKVYALNDDGSNVTGWPKSSGGSVQRSPAVGDLDGDGDLEVIACDNTNKRVFVWDLNSTHNPEEIVWGMFMRDARNTGNVPLPTPELVLLSPADGGVDYDGILTLSYNVTTGDSLANCSLYTNASGVWNLNQTDRNVTAQTPQNFTLNLTANGSYRWNVKCTNTVNRSAFANQSRTFTINITLPVFSQVYAEDITNETAVLVWETDTLTNATVEYGATVNYSTTAAENTTALNHSLTLSGLPSDTTVYYRINATNEFNNTASHTGNFSTALAVSEDVDAGVNETVSVNASAANVSITLRTNSTVENATLRVSQFRENPLQSAFGVLGLGRFYRINASEALAGSLDSVILRVHYTDAEASASNLNESTMMLYWYNTTEAGWQRLNNTTMDWVHATGVNTTENFVWANVTHFSVYTVGGQSLAETVSYSLKNGWNLVSLPVVF